MKYTIVTSLNKEYWEETSSTNIKSWINSLPDNVNVVIYSEDNLEYNNSKVTFYNLYDESPELVEFINKHKNNPHYNGKKAEGSRAFRYNGIKFAHKTFAIFKEAQRQKNGYLIWLDADILIFDKIDNDFLNNVFPAEKSIVYLGRPTEYDECGVVGYNLNKDLTTNFLEKFKNTYLEGLDDYKETHDSWIFFQLRLSYNNQTEFLNINNNTKTNKHPINHSPLKYKMAHTKGKNKQRLQSKFIKRHKLQEDL